MDRKCSLPKFLIDPYSTRALPGGFRTLFRHLLQYCGPVVIWVARRATHQTFGSPESLKYKQDFAVGVVQPFVNKILPLPEQRGCGAGGKFCGHSAAPREGRSLGRQVGGGRDA